MTYEPGFLWTDGEFAVSEEMTPFQARARIHIPGVATEPKLQLWVKTENNEWQALRKIKADRPLIRECIRRIERELMVKSITRRKPRPGWN